MSTNLGRSALSPVVLLRTVFAQIVLKYFQDLREVSPSKANAEMLVAVIEQRAGQQKYAGELEDFRTEAICSSVL
jgi:hypothetical protein